MKGLQARRRRFWLALALSGLVGAVAWHVGIPMWLAVAIAALIAVAHYISEALIKSWR